MNILVLSITIHLPCFKVSDYILFSVIINQCLDWDLVPHTIANALCVNLSTINEKLSGFEYILVVPRDGIDGAVASLTLHRQGKHYTGVGTVLTRTDPRLNLFESRPRIVAPCCDPCSTVTNDIVNNSIQRFWYCDTLWFWVYVAIIYHPMNFRPYKVCCCLHNSLLLVHFIVPPVMGLLPDTENCGCACAWNAGNVFPATGGKRSRHASRHVRDARAVMHAGIAN